MYCAYTPTVPLARKDIIREERRQGYKYPQTGLSELHAAAVAVAVGAAANEAKTRQEIHETGESDKAGATTVPLERGPHIPVVRKNTQHDAGAAAGAATGARGDNTAAAEGTRETFVALLVFKGRLAAPGATPVKSAAVGAGTWRGATRITAAVVAAVAVPAAGSRWQLHSPLLLKPKGCGALKQVPPRCGKAYNRHKVLLRDASLLADEERAFKSVKQNGKSTDIRGLEIGN